MPTGVGRRSNRCLIPVNMRFGRGRRAARQGGPEAAPAGAGGGRPARPGREEEQKQPADMWAHGDFPFFVNFSELKFECEFDQPKELQKLHKNMRWKGDGTKSTLVKFGSIWMNRPKDIEVQSWSKSGL